MKKTIFLAILLLGVISAKAQENQDETISTNVEAKKGFWSIHFGPIFPLGDFTDDIGSNFRAPEPVIGAAIGVGAGLEFSYPLNDSGLGFFIGFDIYYNWLKSDVRDATVQNLNHPGNGTSNINEDNITFFRYFNIPVAAGLNYTIKADEKLSFYGNFGVVANFLKITDFKVEYPGEDIVTKYDSSTKMGVKIGGGVIINNVFLISLNYFVSPAHKIKATSTPPETLYETEWTSNVNYLTLSVGFKL